MIEQYPFTRERHRRQTRPLIRDGRRECPATVILLSSGLSYEVAVLVVTNSPRWLELSRRAKTDHFTPQNYVFTYPEGV